MRKLSLALVVLLCTISGFSQVAVTVDVPTNTTPNLSASYPDLASALTALNGITAISGPINLTCAAGTETSPAGGYVVNFTATTTAVNTVTITGTGVTITTPNPAGTAGALNDAVFKIIGSDYVTLQGFTMQENALNTTTTAASNNMTEWGVALLYATTTNGAQNCTIQNNTISLNRTYQNTFGVYSNSTHSSTAPSTSATATTTAGGNSGLKIYGNNISNVNNGITVVGPTAVADQNNGVDIGGAGAGTANSITNYGTTGTFSTYANVSGTVNGILVRNSTNINVSYNTITSSSGATGVVAGTLRGIYNVAATNQPTATFTNTFNNNNITVTSHVLAGGIFGILVESGASSVTSATNINNNSFSGMNHTIAAPTGTVTIISHTGSSTAGPLTHSISNNTFNNITSPSTGSYTFITNSWARPTNGVSNVNNNSIVTGFNKTGAGGTLQLYLSNSTSGATVNEINTGNNFSNITVTGATTVNGWQSTDGGSPIKTVTNNTFSNWTCGTSSVTGLSVGFSSSSTVSGNLVSNITSAGTIIGINSTSGTETFTQNTVHSLTTSGASAVSGFSSSGGTTKLYTKNKVYNLEANNASGTANGFIISAGTTTTLQNNIVGDLRTPNANAANPLNGINITGGTTSNVQYNTVWLNAASTGALFGSSAVSASSTPTLELRNNIFVNNSTTNGAAFTAAYRRSTTTLTTYTASSNNNLFYAGTPGATNVIFFDGTNNDQTLAAYKIRVAARDAASITENPNFLSTVGSNANFLHIDPSIATQIESAAAPISGITDDYDADTRNVTTPDIGADEFNGIPVDLTGPAITYSLLANTACTNDVTLNPVTITDGSGVNTTAGTRPRLYYKKLTNANTFVDNTNATDGWKYVEATGGGGSPFSFTTNYSLLFGGSVVTGDSISYFVVAQDLAGVPNVGINNGSFALAPASVSLTAAAFPVSGSVNGYRLVAAGLSGTVTIGAAGTYTSITGASGLFSAINTNGMSGSLTVNILDAGIAEPGTFALNAINYNGCTAGPYPLLIKPDAGVTTVLSGAVGTGAIIKLNGADFVTLDGSNSGGTDRSMTIQNTTATTSGNAVIWLAAPAAGNGAINNTVKNCIIEGNSATTSFLGMYVGGSASISLTAAGSERNNNTTITNNLFRKTQHGLAMFGFAAASPDQNSVVSNNNLGTAVAGEGFSLGGMNIDRQENLVVSGNEVQNITNATTASNVFGIRLLDFKNGQAYNNKVHSMSYTGTSTPKYYGIGVSSSTYTTVGNPSNALLYNNSVSNITSTGTSAVWNTTGILAGVGYGDRYYHNSVHLSGQLASSSSGLVAAFAAGDGNISGVPSNVDVRNNIFSLTGSSSVAGGNFWAYHTTATTLTGSTMNYNDLYCSGTNATNNIGRFNSVNYTTLAAWQTATAQEANATSAAPVFVSATDLHLVPGSNSLLDNLGTPIAAVTVDIDGDARSVTTPDMGVDEFTAPLCTTAVGGLAAGSSYGCLSYTGNITASGYSIGTGSTYQWVSATNPAGPWTAIGGATNPAVYTITPAITVTTYYKLAVACATNASVDSSSIATISIVSKPTVPVTPAGPVTICAPNTQTLDGSGTNAASPAYQWLNNNAVIGGATSATYAAGASGSYRVKVTDGVTGCFDTSVAVLITVNPQPATPIATATPSVVCIGSNVNLTSSANGGYTMNPAGTATFIDIDGTGTSIGTVGDDTEHNITMPQFNFNGVNYTTARVGMNGAIALGSTTGEIVFGNAALPSTANSAGNILILPWWDDLDIQASPATTIKVDTVGSKYIIQYTNTVHNNTTVSTVKFQVQLDTVTREIHFVYDDVDFGDPLYNSGISGTVGIQFSGTSALQYSFNTASLSAAQCITFAPTVLNYSWTGPNGFTSSLQNPTLTGVTSLDSGLYTVTFTHPVTSCFSTASTTVNVVPAGVISWTGAVDTDWNNAGNWSCGGIPTITSEVIIFGGMPNYPVVNLNVEIKKLTVKPGASVTVATGFDLKMNGN